MQRRSRQALMVALLLAPALLGAAAFWVLPRAEVPLEEPMPAGDWLLVAHAEVRDGGARYPAAGTVGLYEENTSADRILFFEGYEARAGPNVWFYWTSERDPQDRAAVNKGVTLRVPGLGPAVARGDFWVPVPAAAEMDESGALGERGAVVAWDRYLGHRYAWAPIP